MAQICTKSFVGWGFAPDPTGGAYSAPPDSLAGLGGGTPGEGEDGGEGEEISIHGLKFVAPPLFVLSTRPVFLTFQCSLPLYVS